MMVSKNGLEVRDYQQRIVQKVIELYRGSLADARGNRQKSVSKRVG